jgi:hypothetical protein
MLLHLLTWVVNISQSSILQQPAGEFLKELNQMLKKKTAFNLDSCFLLDFHKILLYNVAQSTTIVNNKLFSRGWMVPGGAPGLQNQSLG